MRRGGRRATAAAVVGVLLAAGCSSSNTSSQAGRAEASGPSATSSTSTPYEPPRPLRTAALLARFDGALDEFYVAPSPLPAGPPGDLIRAMELDDKDAATTSLRIMYHSIDITGHDRAVTGVISYPADRTAPKGGWPVISTAHGTTGIAPACAPSRWIDAAPAHGVDGVRVATDYIGLGPAGELHPYLSGPDEGHSVIDAVRAARQLTDAHASKRYVVWGHSQGGHAALWANELGQSYAPELDLLGTAALAPAAELTKTYGPVDRIVANVVSLMALYGAAPEHPEIDPHDYVGPAVRKLEEVVTTECLDTITKAFVPIDAATFYKARPQDTEPARSLIIASDPGRSKPVGSPLIIAQGDQDIRVAKPRTDDLFDRLCRIGQVAEYHVYPGKDHDSVIAASTAEVEAWLADRLAGSPTRDSCDEGRPTVEG